MDSLELGGDGFRVAERNWLSGWSGGQDERAALFLWKVRLFSPQVFFSRQGKSAAFPSGSGDAALQGVLAGWSWVLWGTTFGRSRVAARSAFFFPPARAAKSFPNSGSWCMILFAIFPAYRLRPAGPATSARFFTLPPVRRFSATTPYQLQGACQTSSPAIHRFSMRCSLRETFTLRQRGKLSLVGTAAASVRARHRGFPRNLDFAEFERRHAHRLPVEQQECSAAIQALHLAGFAPVTGYLILSRMEFQDST